MGKEKQELEHHFEWLQAIRDFEANPEDVPMKAIPLELYNGMMLDYARHLLKLENDR